MHRKIVAIILVLSLCVAPLTAFGAVTSTQIATADKLKGLGLFKGTGDPKDDYKLGQELIRVEGIVMLLRLLGQEDAALHSNYSCPFEDVPEWAQPYVAYAYARGLTEGTSDIAFEPNLMMPANQYTTLALRALGYSDKHGDFTWDKSLDKALSLGLITSTEYTALQNTDFLRGNMVEVSWAALNQAMRGKSDTLADFLISIGVLDKDSAVAAGLKTKYTPIEVAPTKDFYITHNMDHITQVGPQVWYSGMCGAYSAAYCKTILDGAPADPNDFWNGSGAVWKAASDTKGTAAVVLKKAYDHLNKDRPCILYVNNKSGGPHYMTVIGYKAGTTASNLSYDKFIYIDPVKADIANFANSYKAPTDMDRIITY